VTISLGSSLSRAKAQDMLAGVLQRWQKRNTPIGKWKKWLI
jgi:hypothetical protein